MERESFIFYRSFYDAIAELPKDIRIEVLTAIIEYALFGRAPENLKTFAKGMFTLIKPNIDANNTRYINGTKGGRKSKKKAGLPDTDCLLTYEQEVEQMRNDEECRKTICADFNISTEEYEKRLSRFLTQCNKDKERKGKEHHDSFVDCQSHLRYWMSKAYPTAQPTANNENVDNDPPFPASDYTFNGGFGGVDV